MPDNPLAKIQDGLPLGLRFYDTLGKQSRWAYECARGVSHNEYQFTDECYVPPFQVVRLSIASTSFTMTLVCVDDETEYDMSVICPDLVNAISIKTVGIYDYITYKYGHDCCEFPFENVLFYIRLEDGTNTWYSELFRIYSDLDDAETYYRDWTPGSQRWIDGNELRIWTP